jgi:hypothetical protein
LHGELYTNTFLPFNQANDSSWAWWFTPIVPALRSLRQEDCDFKTSLGLIVRLCLKNRKQTKACGSNEGKREKRERNKLKSNFYEFLY